MPASGRLQLSASRELQIKISSHLSRRYVDVLVPPSDQTASPPVSDAPRAASSAAATVRPEACSDRLSDIWGSDKSAPLSVQAESSGESSPAQSPAQSSAFSGGAVLLRLVSRQKGRERRACVVRGAPARFTRSVVLVRQCVILNGARSGRFLT